MHPHPLPLIESSLQLPPHIPTPKFLIDTPDKLFLLSQNNFLYTKFLNTDEPFLEKNLINPTAPTTATLQSKEIIYLSCFNDKIVAFNENLNLIGYKITTPKDSAPQITRFLIKDTGLITPQAKSSHPENSSQWPYWNSLTKKTPIKF